MAFFRPCFYCHVSLRTKIVGTKLLLFSSSFSSVLGTAVCPKVCAKEKLLSFSVAFIQSKKNSREDQGGKKVFLTDLKRAPFFHANFLF